MSLPTRNPLRMLGTVPNSGFPNTGHVMTNDGAMAKFSVFSGGPVQLNSGSAVPVSATGDNAKFYSGGGRFHSILLHQAELSLSGVAITVYDAALQARSGPGTVQESGYGVLGIVNNPQGVSGQRGTPSPVVFNTPFMSGLCVGAPSGAPGFTVFYTPETNPTF